MSIFHKLVEYKNFHDYLDKLPLQNKIMKKKNVLRVSQPHSDQIVALSYNSNQMIDQKFFTKNLGEVPMEQKLLSKSYPVDVLAIRAHWIISTEYGRLFLEGILNGNNLDYYNLKSIKMIIEFLYNQMKQRILVVLLPLFFLQLLLFHLIIYVTELHH